VLLLFRPYCRAGIFKLPDIIDVGYFRVEVEPADFYTKVILMLPLFEVQFCSISALFTTPTNIANDCTRGEFQLAFPCWSDVACHIET
jgi:hypothetical protein